MRGRILMGAAMALVLGGALAACDKVDKPTSDSTPPILHWSVRDADTAITTEFDGSKTMTVPKGDTFIITLTAQDPQGIHKITISASIGWSCVNGDVAQGVGPGLGATDTQVLNPDSQGKVLTSIFLIKQITMGGFDCQNGFTLTGATASVMGTGTNYFSGTTNGTLTLKI